MRVFNGDLRRLGVGVALDGATNAVIEGLQIDGQDSGGTPPDVEIGILLVDTRGARVERNVITDTFLGIFVRGAKRNKSSVRIWSPAVTKASWVSAITRRPGRHRVARMATWST